MKGDETKKNPEKEKGGPVGIAPPELILYTTFQLPLCHIMSHYVTIFFNLGTSSGRRLALPFYIYPHFVRVSSTFVGVMSIVDRYMAFLSAHHRKVLVFWALWLLVAGTFGMKLLQNTKTQYNPPPGTLSATSQQIFVDAFPTRASETAMVILVTTSQPNITQIVAPGGFVNGLTSYINKSLVDTRAKYENVWTGEFNGCTHICLLSLSFDFHIFHHLFFQISLCWALRLMSSR
jgi:hypothetical protein